MLLNTQPGTDPKEINKPSMEHILTYFLVPHGKTGGNYRQNLSSLFRIGWKLQLKLEFCQMGSLQVPASNVFNLNNFSSNLLPNCYL